MNLGLNVDNCHTSMVSLIACSGNNRARTCIISKYLKHSTQKMYSIILYYKVLNVSLEYSLGQIFGLVAFIEQKENDNNDNLCKIHVGLYVALQFSEALYRSTWILNRLSFFSFSFCSIKATRLKNLKKKKCLFLFHNV